MSKASRSSAVPAPSARPAPRRQVRPLGWLGPAIVVGGLVPIFGLIFDGYTGALGANPVQRAELQTGVLTLALLIASLICTPLRLMFGWTWPARIRKALGLLAFMYAALHFLVYLFDKGVFSGGAGVQTFVEDVVKRPFVTVGFAALVLLVPLALTSFRGSVKKLGFARWTALHKLVYLAAALGVVHYWWGVKKDHTEPFLYGAALALLFAVRVIWQGRKPRRKVGAVGKTTGA
ncbi:sulfoxide reductase heme-binding subunit YedZ [Deinococcus irradiatisoli]|uniref:Protein-methionine-sulfoxide reductase heme-binding subunit MsrQ n=1 Tax=Deinococcus irradiatisoli TaxID=2202254 RepID=A0A2Z3JKZ1_9DEIO|nr:protein-methionine-sulfoxide reductase heme-binding subunit MsrQ [Deinococcus irradiatisoli]AWN23579.1 sulfoxide reductase heme-binding subunit YedZ [Deinococcus irradiatisoli]